MPDLTTITNDIINSEMNYLSLRNSCLQLKDFFYNTTLFEESIDNHEHIRTKAGLAVSPYSAAFCIVDIIRTRNFLLALKTAIEDKIKSNHNKPVIILYAGTGPFATLVVPLTTMFLPSELQLVLLEINVVSYNYLNCLIDNLNIRKYIIDVINADATTYCIKDNQMPDIVLSETMKPGLLNEPQVTIVSNLIKQCDKNTIIIPALIKVDVVLKAKRTNEGSNYLFIQNLIEFNKALAVAFGNGNCKNSIFNEGVIVSIENEKEKRYVELALATYIKLYKNIEINHYESSLTIPHVIFNTLNYKYPLKFKVKYIVSEKPNFLFSKI